MLKVVIDNNTEESLTDNPFVLAVDAHDNMTKPESIGIWKMKTVLHLVDAADQVDMLTITITPRPHLTIILIDGDCYNNYKFQNHQHY